MVLLLQEGGQFTCQGGPLPAYSCPQKYEKQVLAEIKRIALANGIKYIHIRGKVPGYLAADTHTCVIDADTEWNPSKGHAANIKHANFHLTHLVSYDMEKFKTDYYQIAGKITRPSETFDILARWLGSGMGILLEAKYQDKTAGYVYFVTWENWSYYFMSASFEEYKQFCVGHFLISEAVNILRERGIKYLEMGNQPQNSLQHCPSEKDKNIALFKRGFGGSIVYAPASEYFFQKSYFKETMNKRIEDYVKAEYENTPVFP